MHSAHTPRPRLSTFHKQRSRRAIQTAGRIALLALVGAAAAGCREGNPADIPYTDNLKGVWAEMMAPYGLQAVFPVRSGLQPGDIYIMCARPPQSSQEEAQAASAPAAAASTPQELPTEWVHLFSMSPKAVSAILLERAQSRMNYTLVPEASASAPYGPASSADPYGLVKTPSRLQFASFPSILSYSKSRSNFGAGGAAGVVAAGFGASRVTNGYFTLEIPGAEVAELSLNELQLVLDRTRREIVATRKARRVLDTIQSLRESIAKHQCAEDTLSVLSAVYSARHITTTMGDSYASALEARAAVQLPTGSTREATWKALGAYAAGASAPAAPGSSASPTDLARFAQLMIDIDKIYQQADQDSKPGLPGIKVGYAKSQGKAVSMDYYFQLPMVFGVRRYRLPLTAFENLLPPGADMSDDDDDEKSAELIGSASQQAASTNPLTTSADPGAQSVGGNGGRSPHGETSTRTKRPEQIPKADIQASAPATAKGTATLPNSKTASRIEAAKLPISGIAAPNRTSLLQMMTIATPAQASLPAEKSQQPPTPASAPASSTNQK